MYHGIAYSNVAPIPPLLQAVFFGIALSAALIFLILAFAHNTEG